jgi:DNA-binding LacI/PurR family transcriptional regulator
MCIRDRDSVDLDGELAARKAVAHLDDLGHRVVALIGQPGPQLGRVFGVAQRAQEGAVAEAAARGMDLAVVPCRHGYEGGYATLAALLSERPEITALVVQNEPALGGILTAAADVGRRIPEDLSLVMVGMSDIAAESHNPPMTTVSVSGRMLGEMAVNNLVRRLEGDTTAPRVDIFTGDLSVRRSSGPAPAAR